jgi:hypothetical protein
MPLVISGTLPRWRVCYHLVVGGLIGAALIGIAGFSVSSVLAGADMRDLTGSTPRLIAGFLFGALTVVVLVMLVRSRRELVRDFSYDGAALRFRTLGDPTEQTWLLSEIASLRDMRGSSRGLGIGYFVTCHDRRRVILDYALPNIAALAIRLQIDLQSRNRLSA